MSFALFAGNRVSDFQAAREWYERLLGCEPSFLPHETEAVWELGEHRYLYIVEDAQNAGGGLATVFDTYRDADGNEVGFGGGPE